MASPHRTSACVPAGTQTGSEFRYYAKVTSVYTQISVKRAAVCHTKKERKETLSRKSAADMKSMRSTDKMMFPQKIVTVLFLLTGISQKICAIDLTPSSPINLKEGRTTNQIITTASGCSRYDLAGSVPFRIDTITVICIVTVSGVITATVDFVYEDSTPNIYNMRVDCIGGLLASRTFTPLTVNIIKAKQGPVCEPNFRTKRYNITVDEDAPVYRPLHRLRVTDPYRNDLTYRVISQSSRPVNGKFFEVDPDLGYLYINSSIAPDFDAGYEEFRLTINVSDPDGLFCIGGMIINIRDINDETPVFEKIENDTIYVPENTLIGSILHVFEATDRDAASTVTYSFPGIVRMFNITAVTGALTLAQPLDYDDPDNHKAYALRVVATDGKNRAVYFFEIHITNVDEPPECDPAISTGTGISLSVPETFPIFTTLYTVLAKDPDEEDDVKFKISHSSLDVETFFTLDEDSGIISTTGTQLDYESDPKKFVIAIKVENVKEDSMSCSGLITLSLQNENDEEPIFQNLPNKPIEIPENLAPGTVVIKLQATDRDIGDTVHYEFFTRYPGFFIVEDSGEVKIAYPMDYEDPSIVHEQRIIVHAFDNDRVHTTAGEIIVQLTDVNDNYPQCEGFPNMVQVAETIDINAHLMSIKCVDKDIEKPNNVLSYKLNSLDDYSKNKFTLINNILTTGPEGLDYDYAEFAGMQFRHSLQIEVSDAGTPSLTSTVTAIVRVTRVNEYKPYPAENAFLVAENSPIDTFVGATRVTDEDWPFNNIKFSFAGGDYGNPPKFYIEPNTGIIKVRGGLDFEEKQMYTVTVKAMDLNNDVQPDPLRQRHDFAVVTINIINVNDEAPVCSPAYYEKIIYSTWNTSVLKLECFDKDSPDEELDYAIISENKANRFFLQRESIMSMQNFQYNVFEGIQDPLMFELLIKVTDELGGNKALQLSTTATVLIHVVPWTTTIPTTTKRAITAQVTTAVLVRSSYFWHPDKWFTAALTITAALFLLCLYAFAWGLLKDVPKYSKFFPFCRGNQTPKPPSFPKKTNITERKEDAANENKQTNENPNFLPGHHFAPDFFDGRAVDPVSGKHFLFNSLTGQTKWV
ncbi:cadherin-related family member 3-like [Mantella aurantiaca]